MIEEMQAWDNDPIWKTYEEEANKMTWEINQKYVFDSFVLAFYHRKFVMRALISLSIRFSIRQVEQIEWPPARSTFA